MRAGWVGLPLSALLLLCAARWWRGCSSNA
jgi:hypothetical protein